MSTRGAALLLTTVLAASCGSGSMGDGGDVGCKNRTDTDTYSAGLQKSSPSGHVVATLLSADPIPPARGTNAWWVKLTDGSGAALTNAAPVATPYMPEHGHGSPTVPTMELQADGSYRVTPLYLFMPGVWQVTFAAGPDAGMPDQPQFLFCIEG